MVSQRHCVIGTVIAVIIGVAAGVGIYFAFFNKSSKPTGDVLVKYNNAIRLFDTKANSLTDVKVDGKLVGIVSFGTYLDETIYYATNEVDTVIYSSNEGSYPSLPVFTANWNKTAIAVDDLTKNVYVLDRLASKIYVVNDKYQYTLPLVLNEPKDVVLVPEHGRMVVLEKSRIIMADMDGNYPAETLKIPNLQALAVDTINHIIYFVRDDSTIESYNLASEERRIVTTDKGKTISLAVNNKTLYYINQGNSLNDTKLYTCQLDNPKCMNECCETTSYLPSTPLEQVKIYTSRKSEVKNPCETNNGDCEQLCLLNLRDERRSCACEVGSKLKPDKKTCEKIKT